MIRNYHVGDPEAAINAHGTTGWVFRDLQVHDNGTADGRNRRVHGSRFEGDRRALLQQPRARHRRRRWADGWIIDGVEIDHNNFTEHDVHDAEHGLRRRGRRREVDADYTTVKNSQDPPQRVQGLWADLNGETPYPQQPGLRQLGRGDLHRDQLGRDRDRQYGEPERAAQLTRRGSGCPWLWGGGITLASSDHADVANNTVPGNCNGITGTQQIDPTAIPACSRTPTFVTT